MDAKTLDRLCKLRRLAVGNPSKEEGLAARGKLDELMRKHGVSEAALNQHEGAHPAPAEPHGRAPFPGGFVIHVVPGAAWGQVFGFGFGFEVGVNVTGTTASDTANGFGW